MTNSEHALPIDRLGAYLESHVTGFTGLVETGKFSGGQSNPTYWLRAESGRYVLRRKPSGQLLKSAHAVDREFRVISALAATDVPVPAALHLCADESVIGSMFYIMEFKGGRVFWDPTIPEVSDGQRGAIYDEMNRVLAILHRLDPIALGLSDFGQPGAYCERQVARWTKQYRAAETERVEAMESLIAWLNANMAPDDGRVSLVHGDYRLDNLMLDKQEARIIAVLDWELSTLGHPFADIAYQCMQWRLPAGASALRGLAGIDRAALGIPNEEAYVGAYCERMGIENIPYWNFYLAVSFFRLAAICQGVYKRAIDGNASSEQAMRYGNVAKLIAGEALSVLS